MLKDKKTGFLIAILLMVQVLTAGCYNHKVDTFPEFCEQITGVDLEKKYCPAWAIFFSVSFEGDAIRDDFTRFMNATHLEKVQHRTNKMAWREGTDLHLVNLSSFMLIDPEEVISQWRRGIELEKNLEHSDPIDICLYGTLGSLFDRLVIHSIDPQSPSAKGNNNLTILTTDREKRLGKGRL